MSIRIPRTVNRALDTVGRYQVVAAGVAIAVIAAVAVTWRSPAALAGAVAAMVGLAVIAAYEVQERRLRERLRQAEYDRDAERAENARLRAGDPSAPTAQLRTLGDRGESL